MRGRASLGLVHIWHGIMLQDGPSWNMLSSRTVLLPTVLPSPVLNFTTLLFIIFMLQSSIIERSTKRGLLASKNGKLPVAAGLRAVACVNSVMYMSHRKNGSRRNPLDTAWTIWTDACEHTETFQCYISIPSPTQAQFFLAITNSDESFSSP